MQAETVVGIERSTVEPWLAEHVAGAVPPFAYRLVAGGHSNLTYAVSDGAGHRFVLRRPPLGHVLPSAHDMGREHRIISALVPTPVPVPQPLAFCADPAVNGAPFYVMQFVDGAVVRDEQDAERYLDATARAAAGTSLIDVLADLHTVDPDAVELGDLGRKEGYVERQLRRWHRQFEQSGSEAAPIVAEVHRRLAAHVPPQRRTGIVHGDYRLDNCLVGRDGRVRAVLDWELCTLGEPLADLGWLIVYWLEPGETAVHLPAGVPTTAPGFPGREAIIARYVERTGADVSDLDFFLALALWRRACIVAGVWARYRAGVMADEARSADADVFAEQVHQLAEQALRVCERWSEAAAT